MDAELSRRAAAAADSRGGLSIDPLLAARDGSAANAIDVGDLFRSHRQRLVNLAFAITLDASTAEEIVQDAFIGLHRGVSSVDNPVGYLQRSVVNSSVSVLRRRRLVQRRPLPRPIPVAASSPEIDEMWERVITLPAKQRAVVFLRFWEDLSLIEIAHVLGRPLGSVKSTLHRALTSLREDLA